LSDVQFEELIFNLDVPVENLPSSDKPQAARAMALLRWAETPKGCGLGKINQELLEMGILKQFQSDSLITEITKLLVYEGYEYDSKTEIEQVYSYTVSNFYDGRLQVQRLSSTDDLIGGISQLSELKADNIPEILKEVPLLNFFCCSFSGIT
jgi:hypothetical protein